MARETRGRRRREAQTLRRMLSIYCRGRHGTEEKLCHNCDELRRYALEQLAKCVHGDAKPTCRRCSIHCYDEDHRDRVRAVMRYAGPRMLLRHPIDVIRHAGG